jgi:murein L,D-transpeptidase YcbB/YkuD
MTRFWLTFSALAAAALSSCSKPPPPGAISAGDVGYALNVLAHAPEQGFAPNAFGEQALARLDPNVDRARRDQLLHAAVVAYANAEHGLSIPRKAMPGDWGLRPAAYDAEAELDQAVAQHRFRAWLDALPPADPRYRALQQAYLPYLKLAAAGGWTGVPDGPALRPGATGPRVEALRQRLAAEDAQVAAQPGPFGPPLADALARFQDAHGLKPTGALDAETLAELNVPTSARAAQIRANLERLRWLPREEAPTRIEVNTAAQTMDYFKDGRPAMHMLAAAGRPGDESPMLASAINAVTLNPPWNVPQGIAQDELYPKEQANPGYFESHGFTQTSDGNGASRLVQQPGPDSALGLVKFDFPNRYSVYLHDTPSKAAFNQSSRAVSHGCVRLQAALPLAKTLLGEENGWPPERVDEVIASHATTGVKLPRPIPVRLVYLSAFPDAGRIAFRPDIYGWDEKLLTLLDAATAGGSQVARSGAIEPAANPLAPSGRGRRSAAAGDASRGG